MKLSYLAVLTLSVSVQLHASSFFTPDVAYGEDNRIDTFESKSPLHKKLALSTAAMVHKSSIKIRGNTAELLGEALSSYTPSGLSQPICAKEKFTAQPLASVCSGFLVGDNILATAGHCVTLEEDCTDYKWVFNYKVESTDQSAVSVDVSDVYSCKKIIKTSEMYGDDFALIELDRALPGKALKIATATPAIGTELVMIGHPTGLPQKITPGAKVTAVQKYSFLTNLDAFQGNSGSGVFNAKTGEVVGILVNGNTDYRHNAKLNCSEVNVLPETSGGEGVSSITQFKSFL